MRNKSNNLTKVERKNFFVKTVESLVPTIESITVSIAKDLAQYHLYTII